MKNLWCLSCLILSAIISSALSAPPPRPHGDPHPFYESPYPMEGLDEDQFDSAQVLKRNPAPPEDCTSCCQDLWCPYINTRCLCPPRWNIGP